MKSTRLLVLWTSIAFALSTYAEGQVIIPGYFLDQRFPVFNDEIISDLKIESITIQILQKPSSLPIQDDGNKAKYLFNEMGRLVSFQKIFPAKHHGFLDTASQTFIYRNDILQVRAEKHGEYRKRTSIDHIHTHKRIETTKVKRGPLDWQELGQEQEIVESTENSSGRIETKFRGGVNEKPYQRTTTTFNTENQIKHREVWYGARLFSWETWEYANERISSYERINHQVYDQFKVTYDTSALLQENGTWCENNSCRNWSMVHFENGLPKAFILMNPETQDMEIWEYKYTLRDAIEER